MIPIRSQSGASTLIAAIVTASVILSISLSIMVISINNKASMLSFEDSMRTFYAAESGIGESLMQLRKQPNDFLFDTIIVDGIEVRSEFLEVSGTSIEATASTTEATRKVKYSCTQEIADCIWSEITP